MNNTTGQYLMLWSAPLVGVIWLACFLLYPGFAEPLSPALSAEQTAAFYLDPENLARTRYSMIIFNWFGIGLLPFYCVIVVLMRRMAHYTPVLAYGFLAAATSAATLFLCTDLFYQLIVFRPERDPAIIQLLNDMAWITFTAPVGFLIAQSVALALGIYLDRQPNPIFKPWVGHFNLLVAAAVAPAALSPMFLTGPLAWDGAVSFYLRIGALVAWTIVMFFVCSGALKRVHSEAQAAPTAALQGAA